VEGTDQGVERFPVLTCNDGSRTRPRTVDDVAVVTRGRLGVQPELFSSVLVLPRADPVPPLSSPWSGGDEETRTPDPLLAKEMLCQLSYVPIATRGWWWAFLDSNQRPLPYQGSALTS
jgi:hypothetical protein